MVSDGVCKPGKKGINMSTPLFKIKALMAPGMVAPVSFSVLSGQVWMVSGASGVGKSQFLKSLADLIEHQGEVFLNGKEQASFPPSQWRRTVMYFPAETAWWQDSVGAHFDTLPDAKLLQSIGLTESILQRNPDACSSGEKQRLALLRGLSYRPSVLLLDELTANLDTTASMQVEALLQRYLNWAFENSGGENIASPQKAIIWISHDVAQCQRMAPVEQHLYFKQEKTV